MPPINNREQQVQQHYMAANHAHIDKHKESPSLGVSCQTPFFFAATTSMVERELGELLCTQNGRPLIFTMMYRAGNGPAGMNGGPCDVYEARTSDGIIYGKIVVNSHCAATTSWPPVGYCYLRNSPHIGNLLMMKQREAAAEEEEEDEEQEYPAPRPQKRRKGMLLLLSILAIAVFVCGAIFSMGTADNNSCKHDWTEASCVSPMTCAICGETKGSTGGHTWEPATALFPERCKHCTAERGNSIRDQSLEKIRLENDDADALKHKDTIQKALRYYFPASFCEKASIIYSIGKETDTTGATIIAVKMAGKSGKVINTSADELLMRCFWLCVCFSEEYEAWGNITCLEITLDNQFTIRAGATPGLDITEEIKDSHFYPGFITSGSTEGTPSVTANDMAHAYLEIFLTNDIGIIEQNKPAAYSKITAYLEGRGLI